jgi:hypothetical protein
MKYKVFLHSPAPVHLHMGGAHLSSVTRADALRKHPRQVPVDRGAAVVNPRRRLGLLQPQGAMTQIPTHGGFYE